jgi:uncharacterized membrane protein YvbJ
MAFCTLCGAENGTGRFCVKCGTPLPLAAESWRASSELNQRPAKTEDRPPAYVPPAAGAYRPPAPLAPLGQYVAFKCPYCQSQSPPVQKQKISTAGWILFVILLLACFPLCWIGLLIKEDYRSCSFCGLGLG